MNYPTRESCLDDWQRSIWDAAYEQGCGDAEAIRDIHAPIFGEPTPEGRTVTCGECVKPWPCNTIEALTPVRGRLGEKR